MNAQEKYETIIGLEVHVQLSTKSKAYCSDPNIFGEAPNTCISPISLGYPGTLPRINKVAILYCSLITNSNEQTNVTI